MENNLTSEKTSPLQRTMSKRYDVLLRLLLIGETGVGKTCVLCRYASEEFIDSHITTIGKCHIENFHFFFFQIHAPHLIFS